MNEWTCPYCDTFNEGDRDKCLCCGRLRPLPGEKPPTMEEIQIHDISFHDYYKPDTKSKIRVGILFVVIVFLLIAVGVNQNKSIQQRVAAESSEAVELVEIEAVAAAEESKSDQQGKAADGVRDMFTPELLVDALNDAATKLAERIYSSEDLFHSLYSATQTELKTQEELVAYLRLSYSDSDESFLYWDNVDWYYELSAYYKTGRPVRSECADTVTVSFPLGDEYAADNTFLSFSLIAALCSFDETLDAQELFDYLRACGDIFVKTGQEEYQPLVFDGFQFGTLFYTQNGMSRGAIVLIRDEKTDVVVTPETEEISGETEAVNGVYEIDGYYFVDVSETDQERLEEVSRLMVLPETMEFEGVELFASRLMAPIEGCVYFQFPVMIVWIEDDSGYDETPWCVIFRDGNDDNLYIGRGAYTFVDTETYRWAVIDTRDQLTFTLSAFTVAPMVDDAPVAGGYTPVMLLGGAIVGFETREAAERFYESLTDLAFWDKLMAEMQ